MEGYLLIILFTLFHLGETLFVKEYAKRHGNGGMLMNAVIALFSCLFFLLTDTGGFAVPEGMLPLALLNACLYAAGFYCAFVTFRIGPFGLSRLFLNLSLLFTVFYGIFFLNEETTVLTYLGLALIATAVLLVNMPGRHKEGKDTPDKVSLRWIVCLLITVVANGFGGILTRMQQIRFANACSNEFQFISIGGSCLILAALALILERHRLRSFLKSGTLYGLGAGLCNGTKNLVTLAIYLFIPISTASPLKTGLGMVAAFLAAILLYKEKYTTSQKLGVLAGATAVVLLAL